MFFLPGSLPALSFAFPFAFGAPVSVFSIFPAFSVLFGALLRFIRLVTLRQDARRMFGVLLCRREFEMKLTKTNTFVNKNTMKQNILNMPICPLTGARGQLANGILSKMLRTQSTIK